MTSFPDQPMWTPEWCCWPLSAYVTLPAELSAPYLGRTYMRELLGRWSVPDLIDSGELLVSELLTNAVQAPTARAASRVGMRAYSDHRHVAVEVWDGDPTPPRPGLPDLDAEDGRGYLLIASLAAQWGSYRHCPTDPRQWPAAGGKIVWILLQRPPA